MHTYTYVRATAVGGVCRRKTTPPSAAAATGRADDDDDDGGGNFLEKKTNLYCRVKQSASPPSPSIDHDHDINLSLVIAGPSFPPSPASVTTARAPAIASSPTSTTASITDDIMPPFPNSPGTGTTTTRTMGEREGTMNNNYNSITQ